MISMGAWTSRGTTEKSLIKVSSILLHKKDRQFWRSFLYIELISYFGIL